MHGWTADNRLSAIAVIEEALRVLRAHFASVLLPYYVGSLPFWIGLLYFWIEMAHSAFAAERCIAGAATLALLFIWMKIWHTAFSDRLGILLGMREQARDLKTWLSTAPSQALLHATGLLALPLSMILTIPFGWVYAYYQSANVADDSGGLRATSQSAWAQAKLWPRQNHCLIWLMSPTILAMAAFILTAGMQMILVDHWFSEQEIGRIAMAAIIAIVFCVSLVVLSPFSLIVALNIAVTLHVIPALVKILFGIETAITMNHLRVALSPTFLLIVYILTHLCVDPLVKATYVIRCFHGKARFSGRDLTIRLQRMAAIGLLLVLGLGGGEASAAPPADDLSSAIEETMTDPQFAWRMPRELRVKPLSSDANLGFITEFFEQLFDPFKQVISWAGDTLQAFIAWLDEHFDRPKSKAKTSSGIDWMNSLHFMLFVAVAILVICIVLIVVRRFRNRPTEIEVIHEQAVEPDLHDEHVAADELPEDEWLRLAQAQARGGDFRLAMRALFLGTISNLAGRKLVTVAKYKSNREYEYELARRAHALPDLMQEFKAMRRDFDSVWYGTQGIDDALYASFEDRVRRVTA